MPAVRRLETPKSSSHEPTEPEFADGMLNVKSVKLFAYVSNQVDLMLVRLLIEATLSSAMAHLDPGERPCLNLILTDQTNLES
jgi:hypothetical protein